MEAESFINSKVYGQPYLPTDLTLLVYVVETHAKNLYIATHTRVLQYYSSYSYPWNYLAIVRDVVFSYLVLTYLDTIFTSIRGYGLISSIQIAYKRLSKRVFQIILELPPVKKKVTQELLKTISKIEQEIIQNNDDLLQFPQLPAKGLSNDRIVKELDNLQHLKHSDWVNGRVSGAVYHGGQNLLDLQTEAYSKYSVANQLHPDVFPGVRKMEAEVVSMVLNLFHAPESGCGSTTSGGTESLLLTGLAAREYGRRYKGIARPEVIAPVTIHAGIEKACYYFGMKLHKVDLDPDTFQVDIKKVKKLINQNTVLLVGSAPNYPHGIIDDIKSLSDLATKYSLLLHVDACLGSFIVSFLEKAAVHDVVPPFDFRLPGVTSISCDTHKYGFAPKGSSIIMYRNPKIRECQYYVSSDWTGGMYGSPTLAGSRPGALMVGCWATLVNIGEDGYKKLCRDIVTTTMRLKYAIQGNEILSQYLEVIGNPLCSVVAFKVKPGVKDINIYELGDVLNAKGWHFASLQSPAALHFALTRLTLPIIDELIHDLIESTKSLAEKYQNRDPSVKVKESSDTAALYGVAGSVTTTGVADKVIVAFLDTLYKV